MVKPAGAPDRAIVTIGVNIITPAAFWRYLNGRQRVFGARDAVGTIPDAAQLKAAKRGFFITLDFICGHAGTAQRAAGAVRAEAQQPVMRTWRAGGNMDMFHNG